MTDSNRLTIEEIQRYIDRAHQGSGVDHDTITLGVCLIATMQRQARLIEAAYQEGWSDYHVYQNPKRGTLQSFMKCWMESESCNALTPSEYSNTVVKPD